MHHQVVPGTLTRRALLYRTALGAASGVFAASFLNPARIQAQTASPTGELRIAVA